MLRDVPMETIYEQIEPRPHAAARRRPTRSWREACGKLEVETVTPGGGRQRVWRRTARPRLCANDAADEAGGIGAAARVLHARHAAVRPGAASRHPLADRAIAAQDVRERRARWCPPSHPADRRPREHLRGRAAAAAAGRMHVVLHAWHLVHVPLSIALLVLAVVHIVMALGNGLLTCETANPAKKLAQRIDLYYFKRAHRLRRWRYVAVDCRARRGLLWLGGMAAAGSRAPYSSGPVSAAHAFVENTLRGLPPAGRSFRAHGFRAHTADTACQACPRCARSRRICHREHRRRLRRLAPDHMGRSPSRRPTPGSGQDHRRSGPAPRGPVHAERHAVGAGHPQFAPEPSARRSPTRARLRFNHQVHLKDDLRGPKGPKSWCTTCHSPAARADARRPSA